MTAGGPTDPGARPAAESTGHLRTRDQFALSVYWCAFNLQWAAILAIVLPSQIALIAGEARKELATGLVTGLGAFVSLVLTPVAGALSDGSRSRFGRRRPFIVAGTLASVLFLAWLGGMGAGTALALYVTAYVGLQLCSNWAAAPYAALIPDVAPQSQRGAASGWMALMTTLGTLAGALLAGRLVRPGQYGAIYMVFAVAVLAALALTVAGVRERPLAADAPRPDWRRTLREFLPDRRAHRDFYWVIGTRCLVVMGINSVFSFFQYFLADIVRVPDPERQASYLIGMIIAAGIPTSLAAGAWSDRVGRKPLVYLSGGLMAAAAVAFIGAAAWPTMAWILAVGAVFGIGYGAYQAVDWALAVDVLPPGGSAAKDMGLWHVALVLPQVLAPAISGALLAAFKPWSLMAGYTAVFVMTALWFALGTVLVSRIRGAR